MSDGIGCWAEGCDYPPEWRVEPMDGGAVYLACGDGEDVYQAIASMTAHGAAQVVVSAYQPAARGGTDE